MLARQARVFPEFDLGVVERVIDGEPALSEIDRAFAHAIYDSAARYWLALEFVIGRFLTQPVGELEPRLRAALIGGAVQILILDKVPVHSAINHAVEWAKVVIRPGAGKLANAVLRKVAALRPEGSLARRERFTHLRDELPTADGGAIVLAEPCLPENELERLSISTGHPDPLLRQWLEVRPMREVRSLAMHAMARPPIILNVAHARSPLPPDAPILPHDQPGHAVFDGPASALAGLLSSRPDIWVQDPASALAVQSASDLKPRLILDLCAGLGTKTRQLAATFPSARILATDVDQRRFESLDRVFAGSSQVAVQPPDRILELARGQADLVLLDVPCSNTGVLARRPEARYRFDAAHLKALTDIQRQIVADAISLLRENPRGRILYSTCSLEPDENARIAAWAGKWHGLAVAREHQRLPAGGPGLPPHRYSDGSYAALLG